MERYLKALKILKHAIENHISIRAAQKDFEVSKSYVYDVKNSLSKMNLSYEQNYEFVNLYDNYVNSPEHATKKVKNDEDDTDDEELEYLNNDENGIINDTEYDDTVEENFDNRNVGIEVRNEDNKIEKYYYKIFVKNKAALEGELSREEMDYIYRFYSTMGESNTIREISRFFVNISFNDVKRILRAFNITKASSSFGAPHVIEELSEEQIVDRTYRQKEVNILNKINNQNALRYKLLYEKSIKELSKFHENEEWIQEIVDKNFNRNDKYNLSTNYNNYSKECQPLYVLIGDTHFGKKYDFPIYGRGYNKEIAKSRMFQIAEETIKESKTNKYSEIVVIFVGDMLENVSEGGMHPGHFQEMDLFQDEQIFFAEDVFSEMLIKIKTESNLHVELHAINGNHDRIGKDRQDDRNRTAGRLVLGFLARNLKSHNIPVSYPKNNLLRIVKNKLMIFAQHGDSPLSKKSNTDLINQRGEPGTFSLLLQGHWHSLKSEEGNKYIAMKLPSVASPDKYIVEELGNCTLPGFILGSQPETGEGFNYKKITLY